MALTNCEDCGHQVSETARRCPNCGAKLGTSLLLKIVAIILGVIVLGMVLELFTPN